MHVHAFFIWIYMLQTCSYFIYMDVHNYIHTHTITYMNIHTYAHTYPTHDAYIQIYTQNNTHMNIHLHVNIQNMYTHIFYIINISPHMNTGICYTYLFTDTQHIPCMHMYRYAISTQRRHVHTPHLAACTVARAQLGCYYFLLCSLGQVNTFLWVSAAVRNWVRAYQKCFVPFGNRFRILSLCKDFTQTACGCLSKKT